MCVQCCHLLHYDSVISIHFLQGRGSRGVRAAEILLLLVVQHSYKETFADYFQDG